MATKRKPLPTHLSKKLWIKAGGRCEYEGCNKLLYRDSLTEREMNISFHAHIIGAKPKSTRGDIILSPKLELELSNLMLLCHECHRRIDEEQKAEHPTERLMLMKKKHEERIELVTGIQHDKESHIIIYTAKVGDHEVNVSFNQAAYSIMPERFPTSNRPVFLGIQNGIEQDHTPEYWNQQLRQLQSAFDKQVTPLFNHDPIKDFSVFSFAPQPLLIKLGTLLSDKHAIQIFQYHRHDSTWRWKTEGTIKEYELKEPENKTGMPALLFSLSGSINKNDVYSALGSECSIWEITIETPFYDFLATKDLLLKFREMTRCTLDKIKKSHGSHPLHIFPAMPVSAAVEMGKLWMNKVNMPMIIYDYNSKKNGFFQAIEIKSN